MTWLVFSGPALTTYQHHSGSRSTLQSYRRSGQVVQVDRRQREEWRIRRKNGSKIVASNSVDDGRAGLRQEHPDQAEAGAENEGNVVHLWSEYWRVAYHHPVSHGTGSRSWNSVSQIFPKFATCTDVFQSFYNQNKFCKCSISLTVLITFTNLTFWANKKNVFQYPTMS